MTGVYEKRKLGHRRIQRKDHVKTQGKVSWPSADIVSNF